MSATISSRETLPQENTSTQEFEEIKRPSMLTTATRAARALLIMAAQEGCTVSRRKLEEITGIGTEKSRSALVLEKLERNPKEMAVQMADAAMNSFLEGDPYTATFVITDAFHKEAHDSFRETLGIKEDLSVFDEESSSERLTTETGVTIFKSQFPDQNGDISTVLYQINPLPRI